jgi:hypothetical protein
MFERISIKWTDYTNDGLVGILTLDRWEGKDLSKKPESFQCKCNVGENSTGMTGIGTGNIVPLSEKQLTLANELMRIFYNGWKRENNVYYWFQE